MTIDSFLELVQKTGIAGAIVGVTCALWFATMLLRGSVRSKREVVDQLDERDKKYDDMKDDRDYWKTQAQSLTDSLERLTQVMEAGQTRGGKR